MDNDAQHGKHKRRDLAPANRDNHIAALDYRNRLFLDHVRRGEVQITDPDLHWCRLGDGIFNIIYGADIAESPRDLRVADRIADMTNRCDHVWREPARWFVSSMDRPRGMGDALGAAGWEYGFSWLELGRSLTNESDFLAGGDKAVRIETVANEAARRDWMEVQTAGYELEGGLADYIDQLTRAYLAAPEPRITLYLARMLDGSAAATAALFSHEGIAGIYMVATLPSLRRQGIASLLLRRLMADAAGAGCDCCILQSSATGQTLYHSLGFTQTGITLIYRREPNIG